MRFSSGRWCIDRTPRNWCCCAALQNAVTEVVKAPALADVNPEIWKQFELPAELAQPPDAEQQATAFEQFRQGIGGAAALPAFEQAIAKAFATIDQQGLLEKLPEQHGDRSNQKEIAVYVQGRPPAEEYLVQLSDVLIGDGENIHKRLKENLTPAVADRAFAWLRPRLRGTLAMDEEATLKARSSRGHGAGTIHLLRTRSTAVPAGVPLGPSEIQLLKLEHAAAIQQLTLSQKLVRGWPCSVC